MALLSAQNITVSFGSPSLLDEVSLQVEEGDRLCLLGRNGAGKSTLLKVMTGFVEPDGGEVTRGKGIRTAYLEQEFPADLSGSALDVAVAGKTERHIDAERFLTLFGVSPAAEVDTLSGGQKRRVLIARTLASGADVLLLDEPTNHLDIDTIVKLEDYLLQKVKTLVFVTHDRALAARLATRTAEIDRGRVYSFDAGYEEFIRRRDELLEAERKAREVFDKKLAEEEAWLQKGIKARRTRNEGRVRALLAMREEYRLRRDREGAARMEIHRAEKSGKLVIETKGLTFAYSAGDDPIVHDLSTSILRGDRVGIVGPNGSGKTTLLKLLLQELEPVEGTVRHGVKLQPVFLDQVRSALDPDKTVTENVTDGSDTVTLNGRHRHIIGYLKDFLFSPDRAKSPVAHLSGGERNRLLLARLFARPSNMVVLDEPTNDLDLETLELLEDLLADYAGTVLLVSHDRRFLDNLVTDCLVLTGGGRVAEYAGGFGDWGSRVGGQTDEGEKSNRTVKPTAGKPKTNRKRKLTFREQRELEDLPDSIAAMEDRKDRIHRDLSDPDLYTNPSRNPGAVSRELETLEADLEKAYARWQELEGIASSWG